MNWSGIEVDYLLIGRRERTLPFMTPPRTNTDRPSAEEQQHNMHDNEECFLLDAEHLINSTGFQFNLWLLLHLQNRIPGHHRRRFYSTRLFALLTSKHTPSTPSPSLRLSSLHLQPRAETFHRRLISSNWSSDRSSSSPDGRQSLHKFVQ